MQRGIKPQTMIMNVCTSIERMNSDRKEESGMVGCLSTAFVGGKGANNSNSQSHSIFDDAEDIDQRAMDTETHVDTDLLVERSRFKIQNYWRRRIETDSRKIWLSRSNVQLWMYHYNQQDSCGREQATEETFESVVQELRLNWCLHTEEWIRQHLMFQTEEETLEQEYLIYIKRFRKLLRSMRHQKQLHDFQAAVDKYAKDLHNPKALFQPAASLSEQTLTAIQQEPEGTSALFYILRQRPDLIAHLA